MVDSYIKALSTRFTEVVVPIFNKIKAYGYKVYAKQRSRVVEDGTIPTAICVPGLTGELYRTLSIAVSEFDSDDHESKQTVILTTEKSMIGEWVEL